MKSNNFGGMNILYEFEYSISFISEWDDLSNKNSEEHCKIIKYNMWINKIYNENLI